MSTLVSRRLGTKAVAAAIVVTGLAMAVLSSVAQAAPIDVVARIDSPNHHFQFAGQNPAVANCVAGQAPATDGQVNWRENGGLTTVQPLLKGTVCLQNTGHEARMALEYRDNADQLITRYPSPVLVGNGSSLQTATVSVTGAVISSAIMNHLHLVLQERLPGAANWTNVSTRIANYP